MIGIDRGRQPRGLASTRANELRRVRAARRFNAASLGHRYNTPEVREALFKAQGWKCCYCELEIRRKGSPIEHIRPKTRALRGLGLPTHGYWWLTWTWKNLLLACSGCNGSKLDHFPLSPTGRVLPRGW